MPRLPPHRLVLFILLLTASLSALAFTSLHLSKDKRESRLIIWAWERPEDLRFIDPEKISVAYLAKTIFLRGPEVIAKPRLQPLQIPAGTTVIPVVRIETDKQAPPDFSERLMIDAASEVAKVAIDSHATAVQIDFDAARSERSFYRSLLFAVRERLPAQTQLSITALGSWCAGDNWLDDLPVDEAVPMLFRMGVDRNSIISNLASRGFASSSCRSAAGISTDEPLQNLPAVKRLYVFNPKSWDEATLKTLTESYNR